MPRCLSPSDFFFKLYKRNEAALHELSYLFWECTQRCNLNCRHCGSDCSAASGVPDLPFEDFITAVRPLIARYGRNRITVVITGGEPLLRDDLADCGRRLRKEGFLWGMVTNGYAYTPDVHARLLAAGMGALTVSLDGLPETHAWLRQNDSSFSHALSACRLAAAARQVNFDVVTCVHRRNVDELPALKRLLVESGVKAWRLFTIAPIGRAASEDLSLSGAEIQRTLDFIAACRAAPKRGRAINVTFSCEAFVEKYERQVRDGGFFCRAGINIGSVLCDGAIAACPNIDPAFSQGSIYNDSFLDVWDNRFALMRERAWMRTGKCAACRDWPGCQGGAMHLWTAEKSGPLCCLNQTLNATPSA